MEKTDVAKENYSSKLLQNKAGRSPYPEIISKK
jgi:hypothetical protein